MDLRFVQVPLLCGHYRGDPIAGAEGVIDRWLVGGALSQRQRLGVHSGELGHATVVLMPRRREERLRGSGRGAVVVGLGEMGHLGPEGVTEAVRAGALRYLLHACDRESEEACKAADEHGLPLRLRELLVGTNSAAQLDVDDAVRAIVLGVLLANRDFALGSGTGGTRGRAGASSRSISSSSTATRPSRPPMPSARWSARWRPSSHSSTPSWSCPLNCSTAKAYASA